VKKKTLWIKCSYKGQIGFEGTYRMLEKDKLQIEIGELDANPDHMASFIIANIADKQESLVQGIQNQETFRQEVLELLKSSATATAKEGLDANNASTQNLVQSPESPNWVRPLTISPHTVSAPSQGPIQVLSHSQAYNRKAFDPTAPQRWVFQPPPPRVPPFASGEPHGTKPISGAFVFGQQ